jgi:hypothetical protein
VQTAGAAATAWPSCCWPTPVSRPQPLTPAPVNPRPSNLPGSSPTPRTGSADAVRANRPPNGRWSREQRRLLPRQPPARLARPPRRAADGLPSHPACSAAAASGAVPVGAGLRRVHRAGAARPLADHPWRVRPGGRPLRPADRQPGVGESAGLDVRARHARPHRPDGRRASGPHNWERRRIRSPGMLAICAAHNGREGPSAGPARCLPEG